MGRHHFILAEKTVNTLQRRLLAKSKTETHFTLLLSNGHKNQYSRFKWLCGWGCQKGLISNANSFIKLKEWHTAEPDWLLGHLNFNLKNELEDLRTQRKDPFDYSHLGFYVPTTVIYQKNAKIHCESYLYKSEDQLLQDLPAPLSDSLKQELPPFTETLSRKAYLEKIAALKAQLQYGAIYEINFCQELVAQGPLKSSELFWALNKAHQAPFTAFYQLEDRQLLCFSPERYLQKNNSTLISQPIKGTAKRGATAQEDQAIKNALVASEKERAENVMIVDLVRNDLSRTATPSSVCVPELFGLYSYQAVHQMVSTVQSELAPSFHFTEALATSFPMGSMTGAPKISALSLIEEHENFNRSLYAGSVGYITPAGNFDFNVIIRSILHHQQKQLSSVRVGSAITIHCNAQQEYEECLLKAQKLIGWR